MYSDNCRNFVGAAKELSLLRKTHNNRAFQDELVELAAEKGIRFSFIPPRSPNFGGLWEANIKVAKRLFKAAAKGAQLNLVELQTLLHQITAILNSRPLTAIDATPRSIEALTPAHFLIGRASFAVPATVVDGDTKGA
uniref:Integrase catalytic domain-containing protein n=1 Tax=Anopheles epiroticus TaxID=199890 RepID=A0A182PX05_9DIPT